MPSRPQNTANEALGQQAAFEFSEYQSQRDCTIYQLFLTETETLTRTNSNPHHRYIFPLDLESNSWALETTTPTVFFLEHGLNHSSAIKISSEIEQYKHNEQSRSQPNEEQRRFRKSRGAERDRPDAGHRHTEGAKPSRWRSERDVGSSKCIRSTARGAHDLRLTVSTVPCPDPWRRQTPNPLRGKDPEPRMERAVRLPRY